MTKSTGEQLAGFIAKFDPPIARLIRSCRTATARRHAPRIASCRWRGGTDLAGTENLIGQGDSYTPVPVDLSSYSNITRIEVDDITDEYGIVYDDFAFDQDD